MIVPLRDTIKSNSSPLISTLIIMANVAIFFYSQTLDSYAEGHFVRQYAMIPAKLSVVTILTSMFLHSGWLHLIGNMWFLWIYGDNVEDVFGHGKYLLFYLLCGVAAAMAQYAANPDSRVPTVGASGAIAGVMGAYLIKFPHSRIVTLVFLGFIFLPEIPAVLLLVYWFLLQFFSGVGSYGTMQTSQGGVAWFAHIGGFISGMILVLVMKTKPAYGRRYDLNW
jgi:rhomboid family protein